MSLAAKNKCNLSVPLGISTLNDEMVLTVVNSSRSPAWNKSQGRCKNTFIPRGSLDGIGFGDAIFCRRVGLVATDGPASSPSMQCTTWVITAFYFGRKGSGD